MSSTDDASHDLVISPELQAEVRAVAATAHRPPDEIVREALERYLAHQATNVPPVPDARRRAEAAARMRARRVGRVLPPGMTIEEMIAHGRA